MAQLIPVDHDPFDMAASLAAAGGDPLVPPPRNPAMPADWAQNAVRRVGGGLADILMAPRRAMDQGMTTEEAVPWAGDMALNMAGAGGPGAAAGALGAAGGKLVQPAGIRAYHGSPHDFDRFDLSKIGTGEGAQSYGHGLYFAEAEPVAKRYRDNLGVYPAVNKLSFNPDGTPNRAGQAASELHAGFARDEIAHHFRVLDNRATPEQISKWIDEGASKLAEIEKSAGRMYEVNINAKPEQFLDWDRPLAQQGDVAGKVLRLPQVARQQQRQTEFLGPDKGLTGEAAYAAAANWRRGVDRSPPDAAGVTAALREAGIPGIKYLDQGSRLNTTWIARHPQGGINDFPSEQAARAFIARNPEHTLEAPKNTSNYVVFDDKIIDILHKYGIGGLSMLPPAVAAHVQSRFIPVDHDPFAQ